MRQEPIIIIFLGLVSIAMAILAIKFDATPSGTVAGLIGTICIIFGIVDHILWRE